MLWPERLIVGLMPARVQDALAALPDERWLTLEEVRVRADRPVGLYGHDWYMWLGPEGMGRASRLDQAEKSPGQRPGPTRDANMRFTGRR